ncbi:MAG: PA3496 family putative envelope integrity protein [Methylohalobius sp.]
MVDLEHGFQDSHDLVSEDGVEREVDELFSVWRKDQDKLAARRRVERYLELKRLREQIGDVFDLNDI